MKRQTDYYEWKPVDAREVPQHAYRNLKTHHFWIMVDVIVSACKHGLQ